ncbi:MAG: hypothetical protein SO013_03565, partial [Prevotella sp.]|nr:hypothetical protein [Prevotella sp.]
MESLKKGYNGRFVTDMIASIRMYQLLKKTNVSERVIQLVKTTVSRSYFRNHYLIRNAELSYGQKKTIKLQLKKLLQGNGLFWSSHKVRLVNKVSDIFPILKSLVNK